MLFSEIGPNTLNRELNVYLEGSKLSLSQVAVKLGVSKGHLSEIKNGKATPALNTGLRILKLCGLEVEQRRAWAHFYNTSISDEYLEVHDDWEKENAKKLNEKVSYLLARDLDLMNAYIDVVNSEDDGINLVDLRVEYGRSIEKKLQKLISQDVITVESTDLGKLYKTGKVDPIITRHASYDLVKNVIDDQQVQYQEGEHKGKFKFHINDVDSEGYDKLVGLLEQTMKEAEKIMSDHKQHRRSGGERMAFEILLGRLKSFVILAFIGLSFITGDAELYAQGGLSGGSSLTIQQEIQKLGWQELETLHKYKVEWPTISLQGEKVPVNNICHNSEEKEIRTIEPVETCIEKQTIYEACTLTNSGEMDCVEIDKENELEFLRTQTFITTTVAKRVCKEKGDRDFVHKMDWTGVFVHFNSSASANEQMRFLTPKNGKFNFEVPISKREAMYYDEYTYHVGNKAFVMPDCQ